MQLGSFCCLVVWVHGRGRGIGMADPLGSAQDAVEAVRNAIITRRGHRSVRGGGGGGCGGCGGSLWVQRNRGRGGEVFVNVAQPGTLEVKWACAVYSPPKEQGNATTTRGPTCAGRDRGGRRRHGQCLGRKRGVCVGRIWKSRSTGTREVKWACGMLTPDRAGPATAAATPPVLRLRRIQRRLLRRHWDVVVLWLRHGARRL